MFDLFGLSNAGNYESRRVGRYEQGKTSVSTAAVYDASYNYETAVAHPDYNQGKWVIVESYNDLEDAKAGHNRWVAMVKQNKLPNPLKDIGGGLIGKLANAILQDSLKERGC